MCVFKKLLYFRLCWVFVAAQAFPLAVVSRGNSIAVHGLLVVGASLVSGAPDPDDAGFSSCSTLLSSYGSQALEHRLRSCGIFPDQGSNPRLQNWQAGRFLATEPPGKPGNYLLNESSTEED